MYLRILEFAEAQWVPKTQGRSHTKLLSQRPRDWYRMCHAVFSKKNMGPKNVKCFPQATLSLNDFEMWSSFTTWWFQPIWKSQIGSFLQVGVTIKNVWNHHLSSPTCKIWEIHTTHCRPWRSLVQLQHEVVSRSTRTNRPKLSRSNHPGRTYLSSSNYVQSTYLRRLASWWFFSHPSEKYAQVKLDHFRK